MLETYFAKPWLEISVGYQAGRLIDLEKLDIGLKGRNVLNPKLHTDGGEVTCHCCPEVGTKTFRKRHTMAAFVRKHRNCGK